MNAVKFLAALRAYGCSVRLDDDLRLCAGPKARLAEEDVEAIREARDDMRLLLLAEIDLPAWEDLEPWPRESGFSRAKSPRRRKG